jgi:hypothetical protein
LSTQWYQLLMGDENRHPHPYMSDEEDLFGHHPYYLNQGNVVSDWNPNAFIRCTDPEWDGDPDDILGNDIDLPIFSARLRAALANADIGTGAIQYVLLRVPGNRLV